MTQHPAARCHAARLGRDGDVVGPGGDRLAGLLGRDELKVLQPAWGQHLDVTSTPTSAAPTRASFWTQPVKASSVCALVEHDAIDGDVNIPQPSGHSCCLL